MAGTPATGKRVQRDRWRGALALLAGLLLPSSVVLAEHPDSEESYASGWTFQFDNDLLIPSTRDQQYTGGFALTLAGRQAIDRWFSVDPLLEWLDRVTGFSTIYQRGRHLQLHSITFGVESFTPANINTRQPIYSDRPYSNLFFISNTQLSALLDKQVLYHSNLTVGLIGTSIGAELQRGLHRALGNPVPRGWDNQISDGGEPTAKYTVTRQKIHRITYGGADLMGGELRSVVGGSVGTTTEIGVGVGGRWGRIATPWWEFAPVLGDYINLGTPFASRVPAARRELYLWGGVMWRYRLYNALLQGQFRESPVTFNYDELNHVLVEYALGLTWEVTRNWTLSLSARARSAELRDSQGLNSEWGSLSISHTY